jgi:hypothetical protein
MTDAIQMSVSREIENRIDDNSSTTLRQTREPESSSMPCVETVMSLQRVGAIS